MEGGREGIKKMISLLNVISMNVNEFLYMMIRMKIFILGKLIIVFYLGKFICGCIICIVLVMNVFLF